MKIKSKLALMYSLLTLMLLTVLCAFIYYQFERFTQEDFFHRIKHRAIIAAQFHLEKDKLSATIYEDIIKEHLHILPLEEEYLVRASGDDFTVLSDTLPLPAPLLANLHRDSIAFYEAGDQRSWVGIHYPGDESDFMVFISALDEPGLIKLEKLRNILVKGVLLGAILVFIIGRWFAGLMLMPISKIIKHVKRIKAHNLHLRVPEPQQNDELKELSITFNEMLNSLEMTFNIHQHFINNASHELKTPLTTLLGESEYALSKPRTVEEYVQIVGNIHRAALRLEVLTHDLLQLNHSYTKLTPEFFDTFYPQEILEELISSDSRYQRTNIQRSSSNGAPDRAINGNRQLIRIALKNILDNALKFSDQGQVIVKLGASEDAVSLHVSDQGMGIPSREIDYVTQPLYRASNATTYSGFGIGLSLTDNIIRLHGGTLQISSAPGHGTRVEVYLPAHENSNDFLISS